ncbi:hypothetical protein M9H77_34819 [Catharanthus roseus]|uniref:Uncharacterized protein n=1 Tax=Catharanthus roseus TaxID=4058 RepID=A0ACB9ZM91_CATRO|nr:hypothetical protein M9H77_34819 [Catharanthus roseus]
MFLSNFKTSISILNSTVPQTQSFSITSSPTRKFATTAADASFPTAEWAPIMVLGGFMAIVLSIASHSMWQQLAYSPQVHLSKKKRESVPEVYDPDVVVRSADKFVNKSFLRKVGNIQEKSFHDPMQSLKSVGVHK